MKKKILLFIILAIFGFANANALTYVRIVGVISSSQTGLSIVSQPVIITDSNTYYHIVYTNNSGFYSDSVYNSSPNPVKYYILTYDCNNVLHFDTVTTSGYVYKTANFSICHVGEDVGVISIMNPLDTSYLAGNICSPYIKVKNYSPNQIYSIKIGYSINGQTPVIETKNVYQFLPNDTIICYFQTPFILPNSNFTFCAYTINADNNSSNDTICKTVINSLPAIDAGVTEVLNPLNVVNVGDSIAPILKFKNYGTTTITNIQLGYRTNEWSNFTTETWNGSLPQGSSVTYTFNQKFQVELATTLHFEAYTFLNNDQNYHNDSSLRILNISNPNDAGPINIILSPISINVGDSVIVTTIFKNFGTAPITSINLGYRINGQLITTENWTGNLPYNTSANYTFSHKFKAPNATTMTVSVFTALNGDLNINNNNAYKTVPISGLQNIDAGIAGIIEPSTYYICSASSPYVKVIIKNYGSTPLTSIPVSYQINSLTPENAVWSGNPLQSGDTVHYTFATPISVPLIPYFYFGLNSFTSLTNDVNIINDKVNKSFYLINTPPLSNVSISGDDTVMIGQNNVVYTFILSDTNQHVWTLPAGASINSSNSNYITVNFGSNAQTGNITCKSMNVCGSSQTASLTVHVFATPPPPVICQIGNTLTSGYSTGNQWYNDNGAIAGATEQSYSPTVIGNYYSKVFLLGNTSEPSNSIYFTFVGINDKSMNFGLKVFPNPFPTTTTFYYSLKESNDVQLSILDITGKEIIVLNENGNGKGDHQIVFNAENLKGGIYLYRLKIGGSSINGKLLIIK